MKQLVQEKAKAIKLRKKGYSYNEILLQVPVAKSSLSLWLKDLPLTKNEKDFLKKRTNANISKGRIRSASELRKRRLEREKVWYQEAKTSFEKYKHEPLFHSGIALYWAEGSKRFNQWQFSNSDLAMIEVMLVWLDRFAGFDRMFLKYRIYAHKAYYDKNIEFWWRDHLNLHGAKFGKTTYKPTNFDHKKRPDYMGCFRIEVPKSKELLCKMKFWKNMLVEYYK